MFGPIFGIGAVVMLICMVTDALPGMYVGATLAVVGIVGIILSGEA
jgi:hypothetical protein